VAPRTRCCDHRWLRGRVTAEGQGKTRVSTRRATLRISSSPPSTQAPSPTGPRSPAGCRARRRGSGRRRWGRLRLLCRFGRRRGGTDGLGGTGVLTRVRCHFRTSQDARYSRASGHSAVMLWRRKSWFSHRSSENPMLCSPLAAGLLYRRRPGEDTGEYTPCHPTNGSRAFPGG
jgi:hypothetical protein